MKTCKHPMVSYISKMISKAFVATAQLPGYVKCRTVLCKHKTQDTKQVALLGGHTCITLVMGGATVAPHGALYLKISSLQRVEKTLSKRHFQGALLAAEMTAAPGRTSTGSC